MMFVLVFILSSVAARQADFAVDDEWADFKVNYSKLYRDEIEETERYQIWQHNSKYIEKHNREASMGLHSFVLGMNHFGDMVQQEISKLLGFKPELRTTPKNYMPPTDVTLEGLPDELDWRTKGYVTSVDNQGQCGSCWAFAANDAVSGQHKKTSGKLVSLSAQNLMDCSGKYGNYGCEGGLMDSSFKYIKDNGGVDTTKSYPYEAKNGKCRFQKADIGATDTGFVDVTKGSEHDLQVAVATVGPVAMAMDGQHESFSFYKSGVYNEPKCTDNVNHAMLIVGYINYEGKDCWIVKNSFGMNWGMEGYIFMSRNKNNQCGVASEASYPTV